MREDSILFRDVLSNIVICLGVLNGRKEVFYEKLKFGVALYACKSFNFVLLMWFREFGVKK